MMVIDPKLPVPTLSEAIVDLLRAGEAQNRADLARLLGKAPSTVSIYVNELLKQGVIEEHGETKSTGGRKGRLLRLPTGQHFFLVSELGFDTLRYAAADMQGVLSAVHEAPLDPNAPTQSQFDTILACLHDLASDQPAAGTLAGVCLGVPAPIDMERGRIHVSARVPQWNHFPLVDRLSEEFGVPALIENDANLVALAEDSVRGYHHDSMTLIAGQGIGVGIVINGRIHHGATGNAGDISHVRHTTYGDKYCPCGNKGCLTTVAGLDALTDIWVSEGGKSSGEDLLNAARRANPTATNIVRQAGEQLGTALSTVVSFFNPSAVYLAGPLSEVDVFVSAIRTSIYGSCHPLMTRDLRIETSALGEDAQLVGAAALIRTYVGHSATPLTPIPR